MTDHNADGEIKDQTPQTSAGQDEASLVPDVGDMAPHEAISPKDHEAAESRHEPVAPVPSKEIVLQRLTPHSSWEDFVFNDSKEREEIFGTAPAEASAPPTRRLSVAAIVAIAATFGAIGGSLATAGLGQYLKSDQTVAAAAVAAAEQSRSAEAAIAKINADIAALKAGSTAQSAKLAERIDRIEKAQAEPAAKLAKLSEAVEKLRAPETTGSVSQSAPAAAAQPGRLPVVDGWVLREVADGMATVQGRQGIFDVIPGDPLPGVGRVDAIRRQDGRWVVVTSRGLIVAR